MPLATIEITGELILTILTLLGAGLGGIAYLVVAARAFFKKCLNQNQATQDQKKAEDDKLKEQISERWKHLYEIEREELDILRQQFEDMRKEIHHLGDRIQILIQ